MVTGIYHDSLDTRVPGDRSKAFPGDVKKKKPHKCPSCNAIIPYGRAKCPLCGTVLKAASHTRHADDELTEYRSDGTRQDKRAKFEDKQAWYSGFLALARERGHSDGWAAYRFRSKFNAWPNGLHKSPAKPTYAVRQYDKYLRIKYIKSKQKEAVNG